MKAGPTIKALFIPAPHSHTGERIWGSGKGCGAQEAHPLCSLAMAPDSTETLPRGSPSSFLPCQRAPPQCLVSASSWCLITAQVALFPDRKPLLACPSDLQSLLSSLLSPAFLPPLCQPLPAPPTLPPSSASHKGPGTFLPLSQWGRLRL